MADGSPSAAEVRTDGSLEPRGTLSQDMAQVLEVIAGRDAKLANKVLGRRLEVAVLLLDFPLWPSKVSVGGNGRGTLKSLQPSLGLGLGVGVKRSLAKVLVRGNALLRAKLGARVVLRVILRTPDYQTERRGRGFALEGSIPSPLALTGPTEPKPPTFFLAV